jgi:hypothetical protein
MSSRPSFTSCGRDAGDGHFLRSGDVGTRFTAVDAAGWMPAFGSRFCACLRGGQKAASASWTAPSSKSTRRVRVRAKNLRTKNLGLSKAGTIPSSPRQLMKGDEWSLCFCSPANAPKRQLPNNFCRVWPRSSSSSGIKATIQTKCGISSKQMAAWPTFRHVPTEPAIDGAIWNSTASDTWSKTSFSGSNTGDAWRLAMRNSLQPSSLSPLLHAQSITYGDNKSTRPRSDGYDEALCPSPSQQPEYLLRD